MFGHCYTGGRTAQYQPWRIPGFYTYMEAGAGAVTRAAALASSSPPHSSLAGEATKSACLLAITWSGNGWEIVDTNYTGHYLLNPGCLLLLLSLLRVTVEEKVGHHLALHIARD